MRVLVACEFSGIVREAFAKRGHDAWSCDLLPTEITGQHYQGDVRDVLNESWDLMIGHPPCFSGDTLVLTRKGYKPISEILIGEEVLTHQQRWRKVIDTTCHYVSETINLHITGSSRINTTAEHPFWTKSRQWFSIRENKKTIRVKTESASAWKEVQNLVKGDLIGGLLPPTENPQIEISDEHLWLMGCYVADGHLRLRHNKCEGVFFSIGKDKAADFKQKVQHKLHENIMGSVHRFSMYGRDFCESFVQFGRGADEKSLPGWVLMLPQNKAEIFLNGYLFGDGYINEKRISSSSISKKLSVSIALLMRRVYERSTSIQTNIRSAKCIIEGRLVNQHPAHRVYCSPSGRRTIATLEGDMVWNCFRDKKTGQGMNVYNLSVEEDESYMVEQCLVHNCTHLAVSGARWFKDKLVEQADALDFVRLLMDAPVEHIAIENPIGIISTHIRKPDQIIQPWQFGHGETKATCLWLKNLPKLQPTNIVTGRAARIHNMSPSPLRWYERSRSYHGIANAMAEQWGNA